MTDGESVCERERERVRTEQLRAKRKGGEEEGHGWRERSVSCFQLFRVPCLELDLTDRRSVLVAVPPLLPGCWRIEGDGDTAHLHAALTEVRVCVCALSVCVCGRAEEFSQL